MAQLIRNPPAMWETWVQSLDWEDPLEKRTTTYCSILAWRIPWTIHLVTKSQTQLFVSKFHFTSLSRRTTMTHILISYCNSYWLSNGSGEKIIFKTRFSILGKVTISLSGLLLLGKFFTLLARFSLPLWRFYHSLFAVFFLSFFSDSLYPYIHPHIFIFFLRYPLFMHIGIYSTKPCIIPTFWLWLYLMEVLRLTYYCLSCIAIEHLHKRCIINNTKLIQLRTKSLYARKLST